MSPERYASSISWGAELAQDGTRTRFRFWAPSCEAVGLEIPDRQPVPMRSVAPGWFEADVAVGAGTRYRFRVSADLSVPDPASRLQAGDVHDDSVVVDPRAYPWRHTSWMGRPWHETVLYEVHVGAMGGFRGVMKDLRRLRDLGVTAIELMPIAAFAGSRNWGYDGVLPYAPDATYGTPEDLKALVDEAHGLGLMMFLDVVYNHFGPDGAYLHAFAKDFFDQGIETPWGAAIDFRQAPVREFFEANALYWLQEYRFDGLRFDAVHAIAEQDWLGHLSARIRREIEADNPGRHVHLVLENENNAARCLRTGTAAPGFDAQWNDDGHNILHPLLTGENEGYYEDFAERGADKLATSLRDGFLFQGQRSNHCGRSRGEPSAGLPPTAFVQFLQNHDQIGNRAFGERLPALADPQALKAATALLLLGPQIPLLFMGEEWWASSPFLFFTGFSSPELAEAVRDGRRREFAHFSAFQSEETRARIPDPNDEGTFRRSIPDPAEASSGMHAEVLELYRGLLAIRRTEIIPRLVGAKALEARAVGEKAVLARWRLGDGAVLTLAVNLGPVQARVDAGAPCLLHETVAGAARELAAGILLPRCTVVLLEHAR